MKFDNIVSDVNKVILSNYNNFSTIKLVVNKLDRIKLIQSHISTNTKLIFNI